MHSWREDRTILNFYSGFIITCGALLPHEIIYPSGLFLSQRACNPRRHFELRLNSSKCTVVCENVYGEQLKHKNIWLVVRLSPGYQWTISASPWLTSVRCMPVMALSPRHFFRYFRRLQFDLFRMCRDLVYVKGHKIQLVHLSHLVIITLVLISFSW